MADRHHSRRRNQRAGDEASTTEVTAVEELVETSTKPKETSTLLSEERPTVDGRETGGNSEESNEFGSRKLKPDRLLFVNLGIVKREDVENFKVCKQ
jgi:hypothetical protein